MLTRSGPQETDVSFVFANALPPIVFMRGNCRSPDMFTSVNAEPEMVTTSEGKSSAASVTLAQDLKLAIPNDVIVVGRDCSVALVHWQKKLSPILVSESEGKVISPTRKHAGRHPSLSQFF